jgi:hypothetical protein
MTVTKDDTKTDTKDEKTTATPSRGEAAVRHLYKRAVEEDRKEDAKLIASVANLLDPSIKLTDGLPFTKAKADETEPKKKVDSAEVDGQAVDLTQMEDADAEAYAEYVAELDGSARLARHIAQMERDDEEMREIGRRNDGG